MKAGGEYLNALFYGSHAILYWSVQVLGLFIPVVMLAFKRIRNSIPLIVIASSLIVIGAMVKRYIIVIPTLLHPYIPIQNPPAGYGSYFPSLIEWSIALASVAGFMLVYTLFSKLFPIITLWETAEAIESKGENIVGVEINSSLPITN